MLFISAATSVASVVPVARKRSTSRDKVSNCFKSCFYPFSRGGW